MNKLGWTQMTTIGHKTYEYRREDGSWPIRERWAGFNYLEIMGPR
jgi:hypothetical protein